MNALSMYQLYHGSDHEFSVFEASARGLFGPGIYLTSCCDDASQYTAEGRVLEVGAFAASPFYTNADYDAGEDMDFDSPAVPFIRDLFGDDADDVLAAAMAGDGSFGEEVAERLAELGHDAVVVRWSPKLVHVVLLYPSQATVGECVELDCAAA